MSVGDDPVHSLHKENLRFHPSLIFFPFLRCYFWVVQTLNSSPGADQCKHRPLLLEPAGDGVRLSEGLKSVFIFGVF